MCPSISWLCCIDVAGFSISNLFDGIVQYVWAIFFNDDYSISNRFDGNNYCRLIVKAIDDSLSDADTGLESETATD